ncbi:hypothetical protein J0H58_28550 [bacterium]|nr:hypothetical protein [bacterium]
MTRLLATLGLLSILVLGCGKKLPEPPADRVADAADGDEPRPKPRPKRVEDPDAPFPSADPPAPKKKATSTWGDGAAVALKHDSRITFGPPGCPVFVVDQDVFDAKTLKVIRMLPDEYERHARRALSPDGKLFAVTQKGRNEEDTPTHIYTTDTGKKVTIPPAAKGAYADYVAFYGNTHLLLGGRHGRTVGVYGVATGKLDGELKTPEQQVRENTVRFSPDGKVFATITNSKVVIGDVRTGQQLKVITPPGNDDPEVVAFSADGSEIAGLFEDLNGSKVVIWDSAGKAVAEFPVPVRSSIALDHVLEWLPDGSGLLVGEHLIDRAARRPVLSVRVPWAVYITPHLLDQNRVVGCFEKGSEQLEVIPVPWPKLRAALKAIDQKADAYLAPGRPVRLDFVLQGLRGDATETRTLLGQALTKRLARDGIPVAAQASTVLRLNLSEQAGETLPIFEKQSPFDRQGRDTGRKATGAKGAAALELWAQGENAPLWRRHLTSASGTSFSQEINDATLRKSMIEDLGNQIDRIEIPYFLPKDKGTVALPTVID